MNKFSFLNSILLFLGINFFLAVGIPASQIPIRPRYISLAPSTTEILFALGLNEEIVAVSSYCDYPKEAKTKESIGDFSNPNLEKIISLKPDYIFCTGLEQTPIILELRRRNLNVYVEDPKNMEELFGSIKEIARITNKEENAQALIRSMRQEIEEVASNVRLVPFNKRPKVFIEIWSDPLTTAGKGSFVDELITLAGGINIAHETKRPFSIYSSEEVISRNPDYIILTYMDKESPLRIVSERLGWSNISAVRNKRLYNDIDRNLLLRPGPRLILGLKKLYKRLYP